MSSAPPNDDQPLGLTVYSMPTVGAIAVGDPARTRVGRWKMVLVLLVCASPVIASYFMYYVVRPDARRNFGELIEPQCPLPDLTAQALNGHLVNLQELKGQWLLVSVAAGACDAQCASHLYLQRQLREGLGKDKDRLDWVWLISDDAPVAPALQTALKDATVLRVPVSALAQWLQPQPEHAVQDHLYLVDPLGNWMMRFPALLDTKGAASAKRDLERLMRASAFWDTPGR